MWQSILDIFSEYGALIVKQQSAIVYLISTAAVGAAGAYFGGRAAQRIVSREARLSKNRDYILSANAAQSLTTVVLNQAASLKKQHYLPALENWREEREKVVAGIDSGAPEVEVSLNFYTPPPISFPIGSLSELVFSKLPVEWAALSSII